jgi:signal transduction histidine kinase
MGNAIGAGSIGEDVTDRKKLERALADYHDRERSDLEKAMYDGLGQELAGIALLARSLATSAARDQLAIAEDLHRLSVIASKTIESCSKIARGFAPFSELHGGLVHAIRLLTVVPRDWSGPRLEFSLLQTAPMTLTAEACAHIYHWVLEGLTHAIKHSGARLIQIALSVDPAEVCVKISDDGVGVPVGASKMMQHRAALLQATLRCEAVDGGGTRLTLTCGQP